MGQGKLKKHHDRVIDYYYNSNLSLREIGAIFGVSKQAISLYARKAGDPRRSKHKKKKQEAKKANNTWRSIFENIQFGHREASGHGLGYDENRFKAKYDIDPFKKYLSFTDKLKVYIWDRDNNTCQLCEKKYAPDLKAFEVHHIDGDGDNNISINLILLCYRCHSRVHSRNNMILYKDLLTLRVANKFILEGCQ